LVATGVGLVAWLGRKLDVLVSDDLIVPFILEEIILATSLFSLPLFCQLIRGAGNLKRLRAT
jgi:hypothetical protein